MEVAFARLAIVLASILPVCPLSCCRPERGEVLVDAGGGDRFRGGSEVRGTDRAASIPFAPAPCLNDTLAPMRAKHVPPGPSSMALRSLLRLRMAAGTIEPSTALEA